MKRLKLIRLLLCLTASLMLAGTQAQIRVSSKVIDAEGTPLHVTASFLYGRENTVTDGDGYFELTSARTKDTLLIRHHAYETFRMVVDTATVLAEEIILRSRSHILEEVEVFTGYYRIPKERATGSFSHVDNELLNRTTGHTILERLEGVVEGVQFNRQAIRGENKKTPALRVRGLVTIESDETPLIVLDNFPYEGDIEAINPSDVESVTVLKDAAAASIWGARAGNGVIVITTKKGRYNQKTNIGFQTNYTFGGKPDLFYNRAFLPASVVLDIEEERFARGGYSEEPLTVLPDFVESLISHREGGLSEEDLGLLKERLSSYDVRREALNYLYRPLFNQQHALSIGGGGERYRYMFSGGYGKIRENVIGNSNNRLNLNLENGFTVIPGMEITAGMRYTVQNSKNSGLTLSQLTPLGGSVSPYQRLKDDEGNPLAVPYRLRSAYVNASGRDDLFDWNFVPLDEQSIRDNRVKSDELILRSQLSYQFFKGFGAELSYQYISRKTDGHSYHDPESYYTRDMVNKFTQNDGTRIIPEGGIMEGRNPSHFVAQSGRAMLKYSNNSMGQHGINALVGSEIREEVLNTRPGYTLYGYDADLMTGTTYFGYTTPYPVLPSGNMMIPAPNAAIGRIIDRYLSYFANASYSYAERYTISASSRWDGSNLFGVKTNQKGVPLWSVGGSWNLSKESFYTLDLLPYQRFRLTYGTSGNVNRYVSAYPTISYRTLNQLPAAIITDIGNPGLRWERVRSLNVGWDFGFSGNNITGSVEYYRKNAEDLIGIDYMAPSTGIIGTSGNLQNKINYANMQTKGIDLRLTAQILNGHFSWRSTALASYVRNKITHFNTNENVLLTEYFSATAPPVADRSRDVIYAIPWHGLSSIDGKPIIREDEPGDRDYQSYMEALSPEDLINAGVTVAPYYGSLRNTFKFRNIELDMLLLWKAGARFRRTSLAPGNEFVSSQSYHQDYFRRWKKPGDETDTHVPSAGESNTYLSRFYNNSEALITKGDYVRLQDINLSYDFGNRLADRLHIQQLKLFVNCTNLGLLWRANKEDIDPEYPYADYPAMRTIAVGLQMTIH